MLPPARYDLDAPAGATAAVVLLHPHPDHGGDRRNIVVDALFRALPAAGIAAVRFDFVSSDVAGGAADAVAALDLLPDGLPPAVVGYSFGAVVATFVDDPRVVGWALVAPPLGLLDAGPVGTDDRPKLVLAPAHDQFCPPAAVRSSTDGWSATTVEEVPSADHFLAGATAAVARRVVDWVAALATAGR